MACYVILVRRNSRWAGQLNWVEDSWLFKQIMYSHLREGSCKAGRPRLRHKDILKRNLGVHGHTLRQLAIPVHKSKKIKEKTGWTSSYEGQLYIYIYMCVCVCVSECVCVCVDFRKSDKLIKRSEKWIYQTFTTGLVVIFRSSFKKESEEVLPLIKVRNITFKPIVIVWFIPFPDIIIIYIYIYIYMPMVLEIGVQSQVNSCQKLKKWYLIPPYLTLSIIRYGSKKKRAIQGKE